MADGRQGSIWDALGASPSEATKPGRPAPPSKPEEQPDPPADPLAHLFPKNLRTYDMGAVEDAHPLDRLETHPDGTVRVASPPFEHEEDGYAPDSFIGQYPCKAGRALVFVRQVDGAEDGYPRATWYVAIRYWDDPTGLPYRIAIDGAGDEATQEAIDRLLAFREERLRDAAAPDAQTP
ncbi:hypothetical protein FV218_21305 [Methylobacterium sp. WL69]|uniref:hypothetical protein n=1 Tax=Methylobacterium sp. WL69 TaxID=2603893 RepID=UPI0011CBC943|nr:hypothetical protein [Methylobacterium sp. WL69]TXM65428.1 hypothetical protein FV218_21305 [Methylobacterium sp. WL69]